MKSTDRKATRGMMTFVLAILVIAIIAALVYFTAFHPGTPSSSSEGQYRGLSK